MSTAASPGSNKVMQVDYMPNRDIDCLVSSVSGDCPPKGRGPLPFVSAVTTKNRLALLFVRPWFQLVQRAMQDVKQKSEGTYMLLRMIQPLLKLRRSQMAGVVSSNRQ